MCLNYQHSDAAQKKTALAAGYTLIELLTVVAIIGLLTSFAVPSFLAFINLEQLRSTTIELADSITVSSSAAVKSGTPVVLCASSNGNSCTDSWSEGWLVFQDDDRDNEPDALEPILRRATLADNRMEITMTSIDGTEMEFVRFNYRGSPGPAVTVSITRGSKSVELGINAFGKSSINGF